MDAIRQSTEDRIVNPRRLEAAYRSAASRRSHIGQIPEPFDFANVICQTLNPLHAQGFLQCYVDRRGVGLGAEHAHCFFQQCLIKHKIWAFHVFLVALKPSTPRKDGCPVSRSWCRPAADEGLTPLPGGLAGTKFGRARPGGVVGLSGQNLTGDRAVPLRRTITPDRNSRSPLQGTSQFRRALSEALQGKLNSETPERP